MQSSAYFADTTCLIQSHARRMLLSKTAGSVGLNLPANMGYKHQARMLVYHSSRRWQNCADQQQLSLSSQRFHKRKYWILLATQILNKHFSKSSYATAPKFLRM